MIHEPPIDGILEFVYLQHFGKGPDVPCCGRNCTSNQCLELILRQLRGLEKPLDIQQSKYKEVPDGERCCGENCTDAQCFQDIEFALVDLQNPIMLTLNATKKTEHLDTGKTEGTWKIEV